MGTPFFREAAMIAIKRILWPTDFSTLSYKALPEANEWALHFSAELLVVHVLTPVPVVHPSATPVNVPLYQMELRKSAQEALQSLIDEKISKKVKTRSFLEEGNPSSRIVHIAEKEKADLIIMSTHGQTGWRRFVTGSVTENVIRQACCRVMIVAAEG